MFSHSELPIVWSVAHDGPCLRKRCPAAKPGIAISDGQEGLPSRHQRSSGRNPRDLEGKRQLSGPRAKMGAYILVASKSPAAVRMYKDSPCSRPTSHRTTPLVFKTGMIPALPTCRSQAVSSGRSQAIACEHSGADGGIFSRDSGASSNLREGSLRRFRRHLMIVGASERNDLETKAVGT
jgi:hypothetical protein